MATSQSLLRAIRRVPPFALDVALALAILVVSMLDLALWVHPADIPTGFHSGLASYILMAVAAVAVAMRRQKLLAAYALWVLAMVVGTLAHSMFVVRSSWVIAEVVMVFSLAEQWPMLAAIGGLVAEFSLDMFSIFALPFYSGVFLYLQVLYAASLLALVWFTGRAAHRRKRLTNELQAQTAELREEQDYLNRQAIATERGRIAREIQSLVIQEIQEMTVETRSARMELAVDSDRAPEAIERIEATGRRALVEMGRVLRLMDADDFALELLSPTRE